MTDSWRCEHCGQRIRRKPRWTPNPERDVTVAEAAQILGLTKTRIHQLINERWLTVSGHYYGRNAKSTRRAGVVFVTRESVTDCAENWRRNTITNDDKRKILQTLSEVGVLGELRWKKPVFGGRVRWEKTP